jgi:hypothetical protein
MITGAGDTHALIAAYVSTACPPAEAEDVLIEVLASVHHIADQHGLDMEELEGGALLLYEAQHRREFDLLVGSDIGPEAEEV